MKDHSTVMTREELAKAIAVLEANNVPPAICERCGEGFYVVLRSVDELPLESFVCEGCER